MSSCWFLTVSIARIVHKLMLCLIMCSSFKLKKNCKRRILKKNHIIPNEYNLNDHKAETHLLGFDRGIIIYMLRYCYNQLIDGHLRLGKAIIKIHCLLIKC